MVLGHTSGISRALAWISMRCIFACRINFLASESSGVNVFHETISYSITSSLGVVYLDCCVGLQHAIDKHCECTTKLGERLTRFHRTGGASWPLCGQYSNLGTGEDVGTEPRQHGRRDTRIVAPLFWYPSAPQCTQCTETSASPRAYPSP